MGCQLKICYPSAPPLLLSQARNQPPSHGTFTPHVSATTYPQLPNRHLYKTSPAHIQKQHAPEDTTADKLENMGFAKWGYQGAPLQIAPTGSDLNIRADPPGEATRRN
ncbi:hypothetical protein C356_02557 [Cryptococcus neoformans c45]|nr:hypothetical protein C356_02557 [Cryptococcus neoformans var. grubii c45]